MSNETQYLREVSLCLDKFADQMAAIEQDNGVGQEELNLIEQALTEELALREKHAIGARFGVIGSQLNSLLDGAKMQLSVKLDSAATKKQTIVELSPADDETVVYVYLFNARGRVLSTWSKLLNNRALHEHSVNRPIYTDVAHIEELIRSKTDACNHGFFKIIVKNEHIIADVANTTFFDSLGHPLLRLRQGGLKVERILSINLSGKHYRLTDEARLVEQK